MALTDKAETTRCDVIDMIASRHDYGYCDPRLVDLCWRLLGQELPDDEITDYASAVARDDEAREAIVEDLKQWRAMQGGG